MSRWFRFYDGALDDPKVQALPGELFKAWVNLLCVASRNSGRLPVDELAFFLRKSQVDVDEIVEKLKEHGLVDHVDDILEPHNWNKRQFKSDDSSERVKRHRAKETTVTAQPECNNDVTVSVTPPEQNRAESEQKEKPRARRAKSQAEEITDHFETWYQAYPLHKGRGAALRAYKSAILKTEIDVLLNAAKIYAKRCKLLGSEAKFIPHPATWLNQERWLDDDLQPPKPQEPMSNGAIYVLYGTDAGDAWEREYRLKGKIPPRDARGGWYQPSEWPPENVSLKQSEEAA